VATSKRDGKLADPGLPLARGRRPGSSPDGAIDLGAATSEHYVDAPLYDYEYRHRRADVNFYRRLAAQHAPGGPILELGCGTGRVLTALARDGHRVIGMDLADAMLERAAARVAKLPRVARGRVQVVRADMRSFALETRFRLIICPFNAFQHLYARLDIEAALACVRAHLEPDGRFALDVLFPELGWLTRDPDKRWARTRFTHPTSGRRYEYTTNHDYDPISQIALVRIFYRPLDGADRRERVVRLAQRQFFPAELAALLAAGGLRVDERYGNFGGEPLDERSPSQVLVCRPSADSSRR
jgi:SAM-dependent methyltransferase